jgi:hypothetical protein
VLVMIAYRVEKVCPSHTPYADNGRHPLVGNDYVTIFKLSELPHLGNLSPVALRVSLQHRFLEVFLIIILGQIANIVPSDTDVSVRSACVPLACPLAWCDLPEPGYWWRNRILTFRQWHKLTPSTALSSAP